MYVGIFLVICQGWWFFRTCGAQECTNPSISNVFGEISYVPLSSKLRVPKSCVWTINPPGENDFLLIIKINYLYSYENDDDLILPDRSSLPRQAIEHGQKPLCSKYVLSELQSKPCLETLGKLYCPETQTKTTRKPVRFSISTLPRFEKAAATYFYTNFQASYLFVFCNDTQSVATLPPGEDPFHVQFNEETTAQSSSGLTTTVVFVIFLIISIIIIILLVLKIRNDKRKRLLASEDDIHAMDKPVVESKRYPTPSLPSSQESSRKAERDVLWMDLLTLESHSDPACNEGPRIASTKVKCEDPPCNDELLNRPNSNRGQSKSHPTTPRHNLSDGSLELPATYTNYATEESAGLRVSENNSYVTSIDRREFRPAVSNSSSQTLNSDIHPTYTMRTLNITYSRPSRSEIIFDETCHEIHAALESVCNSDDMETASLIASTLAGDEKLDVGFGKRGFCKAGDNFDKITGSVMCLTVFLVMCLMQISKRLESAGGNGKPAFDPMRIYKQIQAAKSRAPRHNSPAKMIDLENAKSPQNGVPGMRMREKDIYISPKSQKRRDEDPASGEQVKFEKSCDGSYSDSTHASTYQGSETDKNSEPASSVTSAGVDEDPVTKRHVKGIMKKPFPRKQTGRARKRSSFARFLERTSWPHVFSNKRVDIDNRER